MKSKILSSSIMIFVAIASYLAPPTKKSDVPEIELPAQIVEVHDGDTVTVEFRIQARIRMLDCWAPELKAEGGEISKEFLDKMLKPGYDVSVKIPFDGTIQRSLSLNRILGRIYRDIDNDFVPDNLSEVMVKWGMATKDKVKSKDKL